MFDIDPLFGLTLFISFFHKKDFCLVVGFLVQKSLPIRYDFPDPSSKLWLPTMNILCSTECIVRLMRKWTMKNKADFVQ